MAVLGKMVFKGKSGTAYRFKVFPWGTRFRKISGVYVIGNRAHGASGGRHSCPSTWDIPRISRSRSMGIARPRILSIKELIASAFNRTLLRNPAPRRSGTLLRRFARCATTENLLENRVLAGTSPDRHRVFGKVLKIPRASRSGRIEWECGGLHRNRKEHSWHETETPTRSDCGKAERS